MTRKKSSAAGRQLGSAPAAAEAFSSAMPNRKVHFELPRSSTDSQNDLTSVLTQLANTQRILAENLSGVAV